MMLDGRSMTASLCRGEKQVDRGPREEGSGAYAVVRRGVPTTGERRDTKLIGTGLC